MRRSKLAVLAILLMFMLAACATTGTSNFNTISYKSLATAAQVYNVAWQSFEDLHKVGQVTDADYLKGKGYARQFYAGYQIAVDAMIAYEKGTQTQTQAQAMIDVALNLNKLLMEYLQPRIKGVKK